MPSQDRRAAPEVLGVSAEDELTQLAGQAGVVHEVFDDLPAIVAAYEGPDHICVAVNAAYRAVAARPDVIGLPIREVVPEVAGQQMFEMLDRVYASGQPEAGREWRFPANRGADGIPEEFFLDFTVVPRRGSCGEVIGVLVHATEVTGQVRARETMEREAAEVQRRYEAAARDAVAELQEALLSAALPVLPQARIAARYLVAAQDQRAGGDWFDAITLSGGAVALVVGDVVGHGVVASAVMGQLRAVVNELLTAEPDLTTALARADAFAARHPALQAATVCVVVLDPATGQLRYASCGHPPPLLVAADGTARYLPGTGAGPLGTGPAPEVSAGMLVPEETVLLYSDGLIERPGRTLAEGMADLALVAGDAAANRILPLAVAGSPADRLCQLTVELLTSTGYADDVTTLAAQRLAAPVDPLEMTVPAELSSVTTIRHAFDEWLEEAAPHDADLQGIRLAVTEIATNAIEHAYPPDFPGQVRLRIDLGADGYLQASVSDQGRWREPGPARTNRGNGLMLAEQMAGQLLVTHPLQDAEAPVGARGTTVTLRHRLSRPAMLAAQASTVPAALPESAAFAAEVTDTGPEPCVRVAGPVDVTTASQFTGGLLAACRGGVLPLTADLNDVTILASIGVRALHEIRTQLAVHHHELILLAGPGSPAAAVLDLARLPRVSSAGHYR
jgi:serine phosphatase RsbU (regulator of sigma subunit)/anti-sigma regulatory factor (Ser/Thr protein kinase)